MKATKTTCGLVAAIAVLALPAAAVARQQSVVPPGNSAAIQYTETFPTARGNAQTRHHPKHTAAKVLGPGKAHRLESAGPQGQAVAEVVAETAPASVAEASSPPQRASKPTPEKAPPTESGNSGIGRVIAEATGSSDSGEMGLLLPLLIVCALAGSTAYVLRHKRRTS